MGLFGPNIKKMVEKGDIISLINVLKKANDMGDTEREAIVVLAQIGEAAIDPIYEAIERVEKDNRVITFRGRQTLQIFIFVNAIMMPALGLLGIRIGERAVENFLRTLKNKNKNNTVRECLVSALGLIADEQFVDPLIEILNDKNEHCGVRQAAVNALAMMQKVTERMSLLLGILKGRKLEAEFYNRVNSHTIFRGNERIFTTLIKAMEDENIRIVAIMAIGEIGDKKAIEHLHRLLSLGGLYDVTRRTVEEAIQKIEKQSGG